MTTQAEFLAVLLQDQHVGESVTRVARLAILFDEWFVLKLQIVSSFRILMT
jgi:hypothetical protein